MTETIIEQAERLAREAQDAETTEAAGLLAAEIEQLYTDLEEGPKAGRNARVGLRRDLYHVSHAAKVARKAEADKA